MDNGTVNRMLGYPDDARLLIINADDFGMCHSNNQAIIRSLTAGLVTSTSLMTPCPWAPHAIRFLREHPDIPFAVHLTIICEFETYRWGPLTSGGAVPTLVDATGHFYSNARRDELLARAELADLEREFRAQIDLVLAAELKPTHLDWHCLADGGRADIFDLTFSLAREYGLALRTHARTSAHRCREQGLPAADHGVLDSYSIAPHEKASRYAQLLRELPTGLSEWAVHPSLGDAESQTLEPDSWQIRKADFDFFTSTVVTEILKEEEITLLDFRSLQKLWRV